MARTQDDSVLNPLLLSYWQKYRDSAPRTINFPARTVHQMLCLLFSARFPWVGLDEVSMQESGSGVNSIKVT
jgi:hypothetical protein